MSQWVDRIRNHAVWTQMKTLGALLDQASGRDSIEPAQIDSIERLRAVLALTGKRLAALDPVLSPTTPLDNINAHLQTAISEVQAFVSNGNAGHLQNANAQADGVLAYIPQLNVPVALDDFTALGEAATSYRRQLGAFIDQGASQYKELEAGANTARKDLSQLSAELVAERGRVSSMTSDFQSQFSTAQETRSRDFAESQKQRQDEHSALVNEYTKTLTARNAEFEKQIGATIEASNAKLNDLTDSQQRRAAAILKEILDHKTQVEQLVGVIGNLGVTSGYLKEANVARYSLWTWQTITVLSLIGLSAVAGIAFLPLIQGGFNWEGFAGRVFLSLTIGVLVAYAASQADKSRKVEQHNRKLALELEAIGPYLAPLDKQERDKFRVDLGNRSFGQRDASGVEEPSPSSVADVVKLAEVIKVDDAIKFAGVLIDKARK